jgi:hypothetical protein
MNNCISFVIICKHKSSISLHEKMIVFEVHIRIRIIHPKLKLHLNCSK